MLDGFPRTLPQARALEEILVAERIKLDAVIDYEVPLGLLSRRLSGRRVCSRCQTTFHVETKPSQLDTICDRCGGALQQRADDRPDAIEVRLARYASATLPLLEYYERAGLLHRIVAEGEPADVLARTLDTLVTCASSG